MAIYTARQIVYGVTTNIIGVVLFLFGDVAGKGGRPFGLTVMFSAFGYCFHAVLTYVRYGMKKQLELNFDKFMEKHELVPKKEGATTTTTTSNLSP